MRKSSLPQKHFKQTDKGQTIGQLDGHADGQMDILNYYLILK